MNTYIALLRGINVSGQKKVPMDTLREVLFNLGFKEVKTYIQSGNVVFQSLETNRDTLKQIIFDKLKSTFGFEVAVLIHSANSLLKVLDQCPFQEEEMLGSYFTLLHDIPKEELIETISKERYPDETFVIKEQCVYFYSKNGYGRAKCNNNFFERKLKVVATTRNYKTMQKLIAMSFEK
ncbi:DUF1697 domain-containing protein [Snuella lapsa]|uniref:DUF1697 domain-containing protein n=1 Tax=Snuella lapsa TaxID=870481 RepID=A0ABP6XMW7_9FLAO